MSRHANRVNVGEPLGCDDGCDGDQGDDFDRVVDLAERTLGHVERFGRLAARLHEPRARNGEHVLQEVAPGVFAPRKEEPVAPGRLGDAQRLIRRFRDIRSEVSGHGRRRHDR